ncbi:carbohydrate ABC transporter permease [Kribbella sp. NPDC050124]|uniref:carbohydrate ABC transporter permease n=1 Tax=Kribbella sp. NPDC050124 TaxID=3364114 RepID=UPI0037B1D17E
MRSVDKAGFFNSGLLLVAPLLILEVVVFLLPLAYVAYRSFFDWQPAGYSTYVGFENYVTLLQQDEFWQLVRNQLFYLMAVPVWVVAPLLVAYLLHEHVAFAGLFRTIYLFPSILSPAIVGLVFRTLLGDNGPVNGGLDAVGLGALSQAWLTDANWVKPTIMVLMLWAGLGTGVLVFSAALSSIPGETFEAARLDGAGYLRQLWYVVIPSIRATIVLWCMFQIIAVFLFMFGWIYVLTSGGPGLASTTIDFAVYQKFMRFGFFGAAAAEAIVLVLMVVIVALLFVAVPRIARAISPRLRRLNAKEY